MQLRYAINREIMNQPERGLIEGVAHMVEQLASQVRCMQADLDGIVKLPLGQVLDPFQKLPAADEALRKACESALVAMNTVRQVYLDQTEQGETWRQR